jgi:AcrR family transcriptional regulator
MGSSVVENRAQRRTREHESAREEILDAARRLAAREGAGGLSLRGVATEAGYAPAALYGYFRNRDDLVLALAAEDLAQLARAMREAARSEGKDKFSVAASALLAQLQRAETIAAATAALETSSEPSDAERLFNGRLIGVLKALSELTGGNAETRDGQRDVVLLAAMLAGLALLARSGRLEALGFTPEELLARINLAFPGLG